MLYELCNRKEVSTLPQVSKLSYKPVSTENLLSIEKSCLAEILSFLLTRLLHQYTVLYFHLAFEKDSARIEMSVHQLCFAFIPRSFWLVSSLQQLILFSCLFCSTKNTILKKYDGRFKDIFQEVYERLVNEFLHFYMNPSEHFLRIHHTD